MADYMKLQGAAIVACALAGCSDNLVDVRALVVMDGRPLEGAAVTMVSSGEKRRPASGVSGADGYVRFTTYQPQDGLLPGSYKVLVNKYPTNEEMANLDPRDPEDLAKILAMENSARVPSTRSVLPQVYLNTSTTPLSCTVSSGTDELVFEIDSSLAQERKVRKL